MDILKPRFLILTGIAAFSLGLSTPYIKEWWTEGSTSVTSPQDNEPITSDAFTLRLLKAALSEQPEGNLLLAPNSLAEGLHLLTTLAAPDVAEAMKNLALPEELQVSASTPGESACLFADSDGALNHDVIPELAIAAPFSQDLSEAFRTVNATIGLVIGPNIGQIATADTVSADTNILLTNAISYQVNCPPSQAESKAAAIDFFNANGRMPRVQLLSTHARHYATDPQGNWEAAAIRLPHTEGSPPAGPACYLILIRPKQATSARPFATELTAEQFNAIRTALRESTRSCTVEMPLLTFYGPAKDMTPVLKLMNIDKLFTSAAPLPELSGKSPFPFTAAYQKCRLVIKGTHPRRGDAPEAPQDTLICDHPFLWFLMPLSSPAPPYAAGIVENL